MMVTMVLMLVVTIITCNSVTILPESPINNQSTNTQNIPLSIFQELYVATKDTIQQLKYAAVVQFTT